MKTPSMFRNVRFARGAGGKEQELPVTCRQDMDSCTVTLSGELDYTASSQMNRQMRAFIDKSSGDLSLDLSGLTYLDSSGLAVLIEAYRRLKKDKRKLVITSVTRQVEKILRLTELDKLFGL
jgi:anti-sigma B factor antagonist